MSHTWIVEAAGGITPGNGFAYAFRINLGNDIEDLDAGQHLPGGDWTPVIATLSALHFALEQVKVDAAPPALRPLRRLLVWLSDDEAVRVLLAKDPAPTPAAAAFRDGCLSILRDLKVEWAADLIRPEHNRAMDDLRHEAPAVAA